MSKARGLEALIESQRARLKVRKPRAGLQLLELSLANQASEIPRAHLALDEIAAGSGLSDRSIGHLHLALEEHLANIISHGYKPGQAGTIVVRFAVEPSGLRVDIEDDGCPFNIEDAPEVDTSLPLEKRPLGGLGIHMIRRSVDELEYRRSGSRNVVVLRKRLA